MDVFISWSGERSRLVAEALRNWLPKIINAVKPWLSSADIDKGARWSADVAGRLEAAKAGIICVTTNNMHSDWILFEAGALSKTLQNTFVCPLLIGLEPTDLKGPLAQFQATRSTREDVLKLLKTLNTALVEGALPDAHIEEAFDVWWPKLESQLKALPSEESKSKTHRPDRELLEEILALVRNQIRTSEASASEDHIIRGQLPIFERRKFIQNSIQVGIARDIQSAGGEVFNIRVTPKGDNDLYFIETDKGNFAIRIPTNSTTDQALSIVRDRLNRSKKIESEDKSENPN